MVWAALAAAAVQAAGTSGPADEGIKGLTQPFSPYQPVNVAPSGVNLGEIIKDMSSGSPVNGGTPVDAPKNYGMDFANASWLPQVIDDRPKTVNGESDYTVPVALIGGGIAVAAIIFLVVRG